MSSWIVSDKCINQFLTMMQYHGILHEPDLQVFGKSLMRMNCEAVSQRYNEDPNQTVIDGYKFKSEGCTAVQAAKSLSCFMYQCCEGNVPESKLYKKMKELQGVLAQFALNECAEYDQAEWSVEDE